MFQRLLSVAFQSHSSLRRSDAGNPLASITVPAVQCNDDGGLAGAGPGDSIMAGFLVALRCKGESPQELLGFLDALMQDVVPIPIDGHGLPQPTGRPQSRSSPRPLEARSASAAQRAFLARAVLHIAAGGSGNRQTSGVRS